MTRMVVNSIAGTERVGVTLVEVTDDSAVPGHLVTPPQGGSVLNLNLSLEEAAAYPIGSAWEMTLDLVQETA